MIQSVILLNKSLIVLARQCPKHLRKSLITNQIRCCSAEALTLPQSSDAEKIYSSKIENIVKDISQLTILEVSDLNSLLKKTLNISDAPVMAMGAMPGVSATNEEEEEPEQVSIQTSFTLRLTKFDETKKVPLIKHIKTVMEGMNLVQAKKFVESVPAVVRSDISKEEAEKLKEALIAVGGECSID